MLKLILHIAFTVAAVAGGGQPQDNGQNQNLLLSPLLQTYQKAQAFSPAAAARSVQSSHAVPCRRRNFGDSPNSGWVQVPHAYQFDLPLEQKPIPLILKPQSLTESRPLVDENVEEERTGGNPEFQDVNVELGDQSSFLDKTSQNLNLEDGENLRSGRDNNNVRVQSNPNQNYLAYRQPNTVSQDKTIDIKDLSDCEGIEEVNLGLKNSNYENNAKTVSRTAPDLVQEQAIKLLSKCVQETRNAEEDFQGDTRRAMPNSVTSSSHPNKAKPLALEHADLKSEPAEEEDRVAPYLQNPAKNAQKWGSQSHISLLQHGRVCHACSSYFDPSCWHPNATTTIKYCNMENNSCLTKTFKVNGNTILIRDCGNTCDNTDPYGVNPKVKSCSICNYDMCNSGYSIHGFSALIALLTAAIKYL